MFDSTVEGVGFLHTVLDGVPFYFRTDTPHEVVGEKAIIVTIPVETDANVKAQMNESNTMVFMRENPTSPTSTSTGRIYLGEYRDGYARVYVPYTLESMAALSTEGSYVFALTVVWIS
ncbi:hypothetical protein ABTN42_19365, partial [Acinetobacter baumannii]